MIAASSHCVAGRRTPGGNWHDMDWGHLQVRIVYKPSSSEVMCINEPCRNSNGSRRYTTVLAWSDEDYDGGTDDSLAILTRVQGLDFPTRSPDWNGPTTRALSDTHGDFMRILDIDGSNGSRPRRLEASHALRRRPAHRDREAPRREPAIYLAEAARLDALGDVLTPWQLADR